MFKVLAFSCLLAASVQCKSSPNPAVPYYPQPYQSVYPQPYQPAYPQAYPQVYSVQPKYNVQPAYVAAAPYTQAAYRQIFVPANPAYNPYYYGYAPYPAYPQPYPYPYAPANDGTQAPASAAQPGWGEYLSSNFWNYVPNFPSFGTSENQQTSEAESGQTSSAETSSNAEATPGKGDKQTEGQKAEQKPANNDQSAEQMPFKQFAPAAPFAYFGQPQFYGQPPYQQASYDPSKLNAGKNGAVSSFLFYRNQPQPLFQQPQLIGEQKYYQAPLSQSNQGTAALAYQKYLQYQKQFQQEDQPFQQQQQQYDQQPHQEESSVVVDSNVNGEQVNSDGQQQAQSKVATGSN